MAPFDAEATLRVLEENVFYTSPNVSAAKSNNKLKFSVITPGTVAGGNVSTTDHTITFDDGLYSLAAFNAELADYLESKSTIADAALSFVGHGPTQTANADWDAEAETYVVILRFSETDSIASLLYLPRPTWRTNLAKATNTSTFVLLPRQISTPCPSTCSIATC